MAETLRYEVAPLGVEVCVLEPFDFLTEMKDKAAGYAAHDANVSSAYGDADAFIRAAYLVPDPTRASDPAEVVDAMVALTEMPAGTRPVRTTGAQSDAADRADQRAHERDAPCALPDDRPRAPARRAEQREPGGHGEHRSS
jgi:NAD(P)-dependent dehydrogenase (short-subunit alcohol dehydrogenase family)